MHHSLRSAVLVTLALSVLAGISPAQGQPTGGFYCITTAVQSSLADSAINSCLVGTVLPFVAIALLLSFAMIAVAYIVGEVLGIASLKSWYKLEMWEITKTLLIVVVVFSVILIMGAIAISINGQANANANLGTMYSTADSYLGQQYNVAENAFNNMLGISMGINYLSSMRFNTYYYWKVMSILYKPDDPPYAPPVTITPTFIPAGFHCPRRLPSWYTTPTQAVPSGTVLGCTYLGTINFGSDENIYQSDLLSTSSGFGVNTINFLIIPMFLALGVETAVLPLLIYAGLGVFLPLGIILRAVPFLRGVGGTLIALGFAFAIIYPGTLIALNIPVTNAFGMNPYPFYNYAAPTAFDCGGFPSLPGVGSICSILSGAVASTGAIIQFETSFGDPFINGYNTGVYGSFSGITPALNSILAYTIPLIIQFLLLVIDLIIIYALTNGIAKLLGGTIKLGIGKMKLV
jgi:uncharacterized membrane protein YhdT